MIGSSILHYVILEKIGEGGMGLVYRATDTRLKRTVALKFLPERVRKDPTAKERFLQEAQAAAALNHPNICTIYGVEEEGEHLFFSMEYIEGGTLREKIPFDRIDDALTLAVQIGEALQEAHGRGIVHRDVKADNVMLTSRGQAKVMDFGLAKLKGVLRLTKTSSTIGTLGYMAPEQLQGGAVDARSDIFSFGVLFYEMLTGKLPFRGEHEAAIMYSILNEDPEPISGHLPEASPELSHIISRALEKDPEDRYQTVHDMVIDLRRVKKDSDRVSRKNLPAGGPVAPASPPRVALPEQGSGPHPPPSSKTVTLKIPRLSGKKALVSLGAAVVVLAGTLGYLVFSGRDATGGERIPVAVADFNNQTREEELDGLSGMLITSLEQSRRLSVLTRSRMFDVLKLMGKGDVERIDEALGREISRQANVGALVVATVSKFDQLYVVDMKVLDPEKNEYILTAKEQGDGKSSIPGIIDRLAERTRLGMNERKAEVTANAQKVAELTTASLEAYQEYFSGEQLINKLRFTEAADHFRRALDIDSTFGLASYGLAYTLLWESNPGAKAAVAHALRHINGVPEKERFLIRIQDALVREEPQQAITLLKELRGLYPDDKETNYLLGDYSFHQGDYETAESTLRKVIALDPLNERAHQHLYWTLSASRSVNELMPAAKTYLRHVSSPTAYTLLADAWVEVAQYDSALQACRSGIQKFPEFTFLKRQLGNIHVLNHSPDDALAQYNRLISRRNTFDERLEGYAGLSNLAVSRGEYRKAVATLDDMLKLESPASQRDHLGTTLMLRAWSKTKLLRDTVGGQMDYTRALPYEGAGTLLYGIFRYNYHISTGEYRKAREVVQTRLAVTSITLLPVINGLEALNSGDYRSALRHFQGVASSPLVHYHRARAHKFLGQFPAALSALRDLRTHISVFASGGTYEDYVDFAPRSFYLEGTIYEEMHERTKAVRSYETFLDLWKHADSDIPELIDAKRRLAALQ